MVDDSELPLLERLKRRGQQMQQAHYPMQSALNDMDKHEQEALISGTRKRKAPVEATGAPKNMQRKQVAAGRAKKDSDEEEEEDMRRMMMAQVKKKPVARKRIEDSESEESDYEEDSDELFGSDDDSI